MNKKRIVVVLGMHRSGTSAIARSLKALSVELGDNLMPPVPGNNDLGFWEDMDIYRLNERLFAKVGTAWDRLSSVSVSPLLGEAFASERYEASALIERKLAATPVFGFKDPRTAILLPFWKCVFEDLGIEDRYVLALRNPLEVAESLRKRDKFEVTFGLLLWLKYNWAAVEHSADRSRVCVAYEKMIEDPAGQLGRLAAALDLPPVSASSPALLEFVGDFLTPNLRHNRISVNEIKRSPNIPGAVQGLYDLLQLWAESEAPENVSPKLKSKIEGYLTESQPLLQLGDQLKKRAAVLENSNSDLSSSLEKAKNGLSDRDQKIIKLEAADSGFRNTISGLRDQLDQSAAQLDSSNQRIAALEVAEATARKEVAALDDKLMAAASVRADREQRIAALETAEANARKEIAALDDKLKNLLATTTTQLAAASSLAASLKTELSEKTTSLRLARSEILEMRSAHKTLLAEGETQLAASKAQIEALTRTLAESQNKLSKQDIEARRLTELADTQLHQLKQAQSRVIALQSAETRLMDAEATLRTGAEAFQKQQSELSAALGTLTSANELLSDLRAQVAEKTKTSRLLMHDLREIRASTSWRITKPLRMSKAVLTRPLALFNRIRWGK